MHPPPPLANLAALRATLDDPATDPQAILDALVDDLTTAIPTFLGLTMTLASGRHVITLSTLGPETALGAGSSMSVPLEVLIATRPAGSVVFYAHNPGAFTDLAADTRYTLGLDGQVVLDGHLIPGAAVAPLGLVGLRESMTVNRAIGVLLEAGYLPEDAQAELELRAGRAQQSLWQVAAELLDSLGRPPPGDSGPVG